MITFECKIRVWYKHTDQMGVVHHSNYICYYEAARSEFLRAICGISFADIERRGVMMPIIDLTSKYLHPAHFDELLTVRVSLKDIPMARILFHYEIFNEQGDLLNIGSTTLGFIHCDTRRPCRCPEWFSKMITDRWESS